METWYHCPVCGKNHSLAFPCHHVSLERDLARLAQRALAAWQAPVRWLRIRWDVGTARFLATLQTDDAEPQVATWEEDELKAGGPARTAVVRARLAALLREPRPGPGTG